MTVIEDPHRHPLGAAPAGSGPVSARDAVNDMIEAGLLDQLMGQVDAGGLALTGEGGFLPEMIKAVLERGLAAEQTAHLGYERGDPAGRGTANSRNGTTPKTLATEVGDVALDVPRDRAGTFEPRRSLRRTSRGLSQSWAGVPAICFIRPRDTDKGFCSGTVRCFATSTSKWIARRSQSSLN